LVRAMCGNHQLCANEKIELSENPLAKMAGVACIESFFPGAPFVRLDARHVRCLVLNLAELE